VIDRLISVVDDDASVRRRRSTSSLLSASPARLLHRRMLTCSRTLQTGQHA
jgi:hypothetical protein